MHSFRTLGQPILGEKKSAMQSGPGPKNTQRNRVKGCTYLPAYKNLFARIGSMLTMGGVYHLLSGSKITPLLPAEPSRPVEEHLALAV